MMPHKPPVAGYKSAPRQVWQHKRTSRHARGYGTAWEHLRKEVMQRDKGLCQPCLRKNRVTAAAAVDHIKPKAKGGTDDLTNLEAICRPCHLDKTLRDAGRRVKRRIGVDGYPIDD
jgi:5-methylcytosine-specific restriction protein A